MVMMMRNKMPVFCLKMRCGEWWASSPVLRGSRHPCPLLPITHLVGFLFTRCCEGNRNLTIKYLVLNYCVFAFFGVSSSFPESLLFLSDPPRYLRPVRYSANCFGLTSYLSCIFLWVVPVVNLARVLNASVAAMSWNGLLLFSFFISSDEGDGVMEYSILSSSVFVVPSFDVLAPGSSKNPSKVFTCIKGLIVVFSRRSSCLDVSVRDRPAISPQLHPRYSWAISKFSKISPMSFFCCSFIIPMSSMSCIMSLPLGMSDSGMISSSFCLTSSVWSLNMRQDGVTDWAEDSLRVHLRRTWNVVSDVYCQVFNCQLHGIANIVVDIFC